MILYDDDIRRFDVDYADNHGSFATITRNLNLELQKRGLLSSEENASTVGFASGLKWDFGFADRKRFLINVWESNILPDFFPQWRAECEKGGQYKVFGLSKQIADVWESYGFKTPIVDIGCDTDYWKPQPVEKFDKFTVLSTTALNFRSGINHTIEAFIKLWQCDKDVRLIVKNTDERAVKIPIIIEQLQKQGLDIHYLCKRMPIPEVRDLMARSHVLVYSVGATSGGLPLLEAAAMELPCVTSDVCPTNLYPTSERVKCVEKPLESLLPELVGKWGLPYNFSGIPFDLKRATMHWLDDEDFGKKLLNIKQNYDTYRRKAGENRLEVIKRWTWAHSCNQLLEII